MDESNTPQPTKGLGSPSSTPSTPASSSLYGIVRRHCRERLLVRPIFWTNRHLELLQISFDEPSPAPETDKLDYYSKRSCKLPGKGVMRDYLRRFHLLECREEYIHALFCGFDSPFTSDRLHTVASYEDIELREAGSEWVDSKYPEYPICAYIDSGRIEEWRRQSLYLHRCSPQNAPVYAMFSQKLKQLRPANLLKDPYIAALLIALAQYRRVVLASEKPEDLSALEIYPSQVLYSLERQSSVYLYKADIPSSFLDMFDHPAIAPPTTPQISIQVFEIPRKPIDSEWKSRASTWGSEELYASRVILMIEKEEIAPLSTFYPETEQTLNARLKAFIDGFRNFNDLDWLSEPNLVRESKYDGLGNIWAAIGAFLRSEQFAINVYGPRLLKLSLPLVLPNSLLAHSGQCGKQLSQRTRTFKR
ncbi:hypothetical protein GGI43DRAFT_383658 [Trichoderma evansii]